MCLGVPAKIESIDGDFAQANIGGASIRIGIQLLDTVVVGDYVLVHTGFALEKLSIDDALETLRNLYEIGALNDEYNPEIT